MGERLLIFEAEGGGGPVDEANLEAWYRADGTVYNTGTTQATDGQTVATWVDETGNGHDITQGTEGDKPLFQTAEQNGLPGIQFVSSDFLTLGSALLTAAPITAYVVFESASITSEQTLIQFVDVSAATSMFWFLANGTVSGDPISWFPRNGGGAFRADTTTGYSANVTHLATGQEASSTSRFAWIDGGSVGTETTSVVPPGIDDFAVGMARDSSVGQPLTGFIYEIRVYDVAHDTSTREAVEAQMNARWGL